MTEAAPISGSLEANLVAIERLGWGWELTHLTPGKSAYACSAWKGQSDSGVRIHFATQAASPRLATAEVLKAIREATG